MQNKRSAAFAVSDLIAFTTRFKYAADESHIVCEEEEKTFSNRTNQIAKLPTMLNLLVGSNVNFKDFADDAEG